MRPVFRCLPAIVLLAAVSAAAAEPALTLKPNDVWVMAGDSITAQRLHTNFIEAYYRTRYPGMNLQFRNSGIGGNVAAHVRARFDYDIAAWKPTIVSIELGMNDVNKGDDPSGYIQGMRDLVAKIRAIGAQPVLISSSPVNDGSVMTQFKSVPCRRLDAYTDALKKLAAEEHVVFVDQYHPLLAVWGQNKNKASGSIPLGGDAVHPGPIGQYTMAATILSALGADGAVSSATLKADGTLVESKRCKISDVSSSDGKLRFTRLDEAGPWPMSPGGMKAIELLPEVAGLSRYMLSVSDLPAGSYQVTIDEKPAAVLTDKQLAAGWNMTTAGEGVLAERSAEILGLIGKLESPLNNAWRAASRAHDQPKLAAAQKAIDECEAEIRKACTPVPLRFTIEKQK